MTNAIILQHIGGVKKEVETRYASRWYGRKESPNLLVYWPTTGILSLFLYENCLSLRKHQQALWKAENLIECWSIWINLCEGRTKELWNLIPKEYQKNELVLAGLNNRCTNVKHAR